MISDHYNETITTKRMEFIDETRIKKSLITKLEDISCHIQPLTPEIARGLDVSFGKDFLMICDLCDIQEGDRVFRSSGKEYRVIGLETYEQFIGRPRHLEVIIRIFES